MQFNARLGRFEFCLFSQPGKEQRDRIVTHLLHMLTSTADHERRSASLFTGNVIARDNFECQYCGVRLGSRDVTLDHIVPRSLGGQTTWTNVVCSCMRCNTKKGDKSLTKSGMTLKQIPTKPDWLPVLNVRFHGSVPEVWHPFLGF